MPQLFPFTAIVGQERMRSALVCNAVNPQIGGVLLRGERGSAKTTAARALAALLPPIRVVADCPFSCNPDAPEEQCDRCRERAARGETLASAERQTRFVNLPVSATEDRVVGTLDIEKAIKHGERHFEPGVLASANRGLLYVDEVNLLDDHVVDLLLDSAAMGVNVVEREGISFTHPARFILVGSMNPEEGELRPQLLDRFALCVDIHSVAQAPQRVEILERSIAFERDPVAFCRAWRAEEEALSRRIGRARALLPSVQHERADLFAIGELMAHLHVDGHRGDIVVLKTALTLAALDGRERLETHDILTATELALAHRLKRQPLESAEAQMHSVSETLQEIRRSQVESPAQAEAPLPEVESSEEKKTTLPRR
jgi:Mg-chelatase subunit ChlI